GVGGGEGPPEECGGYSISGGDGRSGLQGFGGRSVGGGTAGRRGLGSGLRGFGGHSVGTAEGRDGEGRSEEEGTESHVQILIRAKWRPSRAFSFLPKPSKGASPNTPPWNRQSARGRPAARPKRQPRRGASGSASWRAESARVSSEGREAPRTKEALVPHRAS